MAQQETSIPLATIEKLDKECHDNALDLAKDIARNLNIQTQAGESIQGEDGSTGAQGPAGNDGADGKDGVNGITPTMVLYESDLDIGTTEVDGQLPILSDVVPFVAFYWGDEATPPVSAPPVWYFQENSTTSKTDVKFTAATTEVWGIKIGYYETTP